MTLTQIENAISSLPNHDLAELTRWLGDYIASQLDNEEWDRKIAADSASGKLDSFHNAAMQQVKSGQITDI
jgi:hypothetical protein